MAANQPSATAVNPLSDPSSPYYMHPNENPGAVLVSNPLNGSNYHSWSRSMSMALKSKNEVQFIDGTLPKPLPNQPSFASWDRCNTLVLSWINQSLDPSISQSVLWLETAFEVWNDLKERYYQGDIFRICDLQEELYGIKQGTLSISEYFTQLKGLWQELDNFRPIPSCTCEVKCTCNLVSVVKSYREIDYVIRFLKGLNEQYSSVRSHVMLIEPLPTINKVFSMLIQQERQMNFAYEDSKVLINNTDDTFGRGRARGRGFRNPAPGILGRGRGSSGRGSNNANYNSKICTYCNRNGHTVDVCYKKHGFPPNFKRINNVNTVSAEDPDDEHDTDNAQNGMNEQNNMPFTLDQQQAILSLLKSGISQDSHAANQVSSCSPGSYAPTASWHKTKIQKEHNFLRFQQLSLNHPCKGIKGGSTCQGCNRKYVVNATSEQSFESDSRDLDPKNIWDSFKNSLDAFYRFSRPHTVIGTALSIVSVSLLAVEKVSDLSPLFFTGVLEAVVAALFMNIYIVGLNQLSDVEIDKINKPYLPLASGEYSFQTGVIIVASFSILSFWLSWIVGSQPLFWALFVSFVLGTAYSVNVPQLRWKRFPVLAAICIMAVRAVVVQLAFFLHMQTYVYNRPAVFSRPLIFATAFMGFFSVVIALFKDIPDIEGDKIFGIQSFSVRLGQKKVFWICVSLLEMAYGCALLMGAASPCLWSKIVTVPGHAVLALVLWYHAKSVDFKSKASITSFYMFIWKLFYAEYFLIPLVR